MDGSLTLASAAKVTRPPPTYQPLLRAFLAIALGIVIDRRVCFSPLLWCISFPLVLLLWYVLFRSKKYQLSSLALLACLVVVGGAWHNLQWNWIGQRDIATFAKDAPNPIMVHGAIVKQPVWLAVSDPNSGTRQPTERSKLTVSVDSIRDDGFFRPASGLVQVFFDGKTTGLFSGDRIEVVGNLVPIKPPANPGDFDFQQSLRHQHIHCQLEAPTPQAVKKMGRVNLFKNSISRLRSDLDQVLWFYLEPTRAPLASAMLLGNRSQLTSENRDEFLTSGTLHVLAISGLHVGILAGLFLLLPRLGLLPRRWGLGVTMAFVFFYAALVEFRPPVTRAAILISVFCYCRIVGRVALSFNSLAFAGIIVVAINPMDIFSAGAQLSFLAVATLIHFKTWLAPPEVSDPIDQLIEKSLTPRERMKKHVLRVAYSTLLVSAIIWSFALPAVASQFHIVAPIALIANPILLVPLFSSLVFGAGVLAFGTWFPALAHLMAAGCNGSLWLIQKIVETSSQLPLGHWWTAGPTPTMVTVFYATLLVFYFCFKVPRPKWLLFFGGAWVLCGWIIPDAQAYWKAQNRQNLVMTVLDVGHGSCVLLELPNGKNVLYDCGRYGSARAAESTAASLLWKKRIGKLDAVFVSHADSDHFNGLPGLAEKFRIERVLISKNLSRQLSHKPSFQNTILNMEGRGVLRETVAQGDLLMFGASLRMAILNPADGAVTNSDNEDSIVIAIEFQGNRILLPGDLEGEALSQLLDSKPTIYDIAMAPHHGSRNSAPEHFIQWCRPTFLIVSAGQGKNTEILDYADRDPYPSILHTAYTGAVRIELQDHSIRVDAWHHPQLENSIRSAHLPASNTLDYE